MNPVYEFLFKAAANIVVLAEGLNLYCHDYYNNKRENYL
jgi:hypothetical protein